jgi:hypothetical protein
METIQIHESKASKAPRRARAKLLRYGHVAMALATGLALPVLTATGFVLWYAHHHVLFGSAVNTAIAILCLVVLSAHGVAKCSPMYALTAMAGIGLAWFLPKGLGFGLLLVGLTLFVGLAIAAEIYRRLRERHCEPEAGQTPEELNPRCGTCHAQFLPVPAGRHSGPVHREE